MAERVTWSEYRKAIGDRSGLFADSDLVSAELARDDIPAEAVPV